MVVSHSLEFDFIRRQTLCFAAEAACTVGSTELLQHNVNSKTLFADREHGA